MRKNWFFVLCVLAVIVRSTADDFNAVRDPIIRDWSDYNLQMLSLSFPHFSPPMLARELAMINTAMYNVYAAYDSQAVPVVDSGVGRLAEERRTMPNFRSSVSFAVYRTMLHLFNGVKGGVLVSNITQRMQTLGYDPNDVDVDPSTAVGLGNRVAAALIKYRINDGSNANGAEPGSTTAGTYSDYTNYFPVNDPQSIPGHTTCDVEIRSLNHWQPLRVPSASIPSSSSVQTFAAPHASMMQPFALSHAAEFRPSDGVSLLGTERESAVWDSAREVLRYSAELDDRRKVVAEYWADGPNSELPPGHWQKFALWLADTRQLSVGATAKLLFLQGNAVFDAGIACWDSKRFFDSARPVTLIQCLFAGSQIYAWGGPYRGTELIDGSEWMPYQSPSFITPPFSEYVSGHSSFSSASAEVFARFFGSDDFGFSVTVLEGTSLFEPRITDPQHPLFRDGVTNKANTGAGTPGYSPAHDVTLQYATFSAAAEEAGISRIFGGIHFGPANVDGQKIGRQVGEKVFATAVKYFNGTANPTVVTF